MGLMRSIVAHRWCIIPRVKRKMSKILTTNFIEYLIKFNKALSGRFYFKVVTGIRGLVAPILAEYVTK